MSRALKLRLDNTPKKQKKQKNKKTKKKNKKKCYLSNPINNELEAYLTINRVILIEEKYR